jgi:hypothetical protein
MPVAVAAVVVFAVLAVSLVGGLLLYVLVRAEGPDAAATDREEAERLARRDTEE